MEKEFIDYKKMYYLCIDCMVTLPKQTQLTRQLIKDSLATLTFLDDCVSKHDFDVACEKAEKYIENMSF